MNYYKDEETVVPIDDFLKKKVLSRLDKDSGDVMVSAEYWDLGFCDTCSCPESGFAVYVDEKLVWPNEESLRAMGGYIYADDSGRVISGKLSTYGYFFEWLDRKDLVKIMDEIDNFYLDEYDE